MISLDLHGVKYGDAENLVDSFIGRYYNKLPIEIITGNSVEMQKILREIVQSYDLRMEPVNYVNLGSYVISYK